MLQACWVQHASWIVASWMVSVMRAFSSVNKRSENCSGRPGRIFQNIFVFIFIQE